MDNTPHKLHNMNMDDTEDEEVKRNCFGKMHYTETSEEDEDSDEESTMSSNSIKLFVNHKPSGKGVFQPKPIVLDRIVEQREPPLKKIIHNECEFSDDDDEDEGNDVDEEENSHGFHNGHDKLNIPSFKNEEFISERDYTTNTGSEEDADEDDEEEEEDNDGDEEEADSESDEDGPLETSGVLTDDDNDAEDDDDSEGESVEEDELEENSCSDSDDGDEKFEYVCVTNGSDQNLHLAFETLHEYVSETKGDGTYDVNIHIDAHDDGSISADTIEDIIEKKDVNDILFSDEEDEEISNESKATRVGTDIDEDEMISFLADQTQDSKDDISHLKRSYSKQEFNQISPEDGFIDHKRNCRRLSQRAKSLQDIVPPFLPRLSLGRSALADDEDYRAHDDNSSDDEGDDEAVDNQLAEELMDGITSKDPNGDSSPVPLLTPPASPTPFDIGNSSASDSQKIIVCEWPSNMAVDNALTAVNELRPMSPSSLEKLEEESMKREDFMTPTSMYQNRSRSISDVSSGLTPNFGNLNMTKL